MTYIFNWVVNEGIHKHIGLPKIEKVFNAWHACSVHNKLKNFVGEEQSKIQQHV